MKIFASIFLFLLASCASIPAPSHPSGLVVTLASFDLVSMTTKKPVPLGHHGDLALAIVPEGNYSLSASGTTSPPFRVESGQVVLAPWLLGTNSEWLPTDPSTALQVMQDLQNLHGFSEWLGADWRGFEPHEIPRLMVGKSSTVRVRTSPVSARVTMNGVSLGWTPLEITVPFQGAMVELESPGYKPVRTYARWGEVGNLEWTLIPSVVPYDDTPTSTLRVLVFPFAHGGDSGPYSETIAEALAVNLRRKPEFSVESIRTISLGDGFWKEAETKGAHLAIAGWYRLVPGGLLIQATLYDIASRRVIHTDVFNVTEGLRLFDELDDRSALFIAKGVQGLPEPGAFYTIKQPPLSGDYLLLEQDAWTTRQRDQMTMPGAWASVSTGFGIFFPSRNLAGFTSAPPAAFLRARGGYRFLPFLSVTGAVSAGLPERNAIWKSHPASPLSTRWLLASGGLEVSIVNGPFFVYLGPEFSLGWEFPSQRSSGFPYTHLGATLDLGIRGMLHSHTRDSGLFWQAGMWADLGLWTIKKGARLPSEMLGYLHVGLGYRW